MPITTNKTLQVMMILLPISLFALFVLFLRNSMVSSPLPTKTTKEIETSSTNTAIKMTETPLLSMFPTTLAKSTVVLTAHGTQIPSKSPTIRATKTIAPVTHFPNTVPTISASLPSNVQKYLQSTSDDAPTRALKINQLLSTKCERPCWWGMDPAMQDIDLVRQILNALPLAYGYNAKAGEIESELYGDNEHEISETYLVFDSFYNYYWIRFSTRFFRDRQIRANLLGEFHPYSLLQKYEPSGAFIRLAEGGDFLGPTVVFLTLYFDELRLSTEYEFYVSDRKNDDTTDYGATGDGATICLETARIQTVELVFFDVFPKHDISNVNRNSALL